VVQRCFDLNLLIVTIDSRKAIDMASGGIAIKRPPSLHMTMRATEIAFSRASGEVKVKRYFTLVPEVNGTASKAAIGMDVQAIRNRLPSSKPWLLLWMQIRVRSMARRNP
jgi:hypothetical protein